MMALARTLAPERARNDTKIEKGNGKTDALIQRHLRCPGNGGTIDESAQSSGSQDALVVLVAITRQNVK